MTDDEREAREWLDRICDGNKHARTIWRLLDAPRMPHPASVPDEVWQAANETFHRFAYTVPGIQAAYRVLCDHYTAPPAPKKVEAWAIINPRTRFKFSFHDTEAEARAQMERAYGPSGYEIVKLVEAADE